MKKYLISIIIILTLKNLVLGQSPSPNIPIQDLSPLYLPGFITANTALTDIIPSANLAEINSVTTNSKVFLPKITNENQRIAQTKEKLGYDKSRYPDVKTDGFIELKLSGRDHSDELEKLDLIRNDPIYQKLPMDVLKGDPKLDMRYLISVEGKLDDDLAVRYDIEKEPDFPGKYNIRIKKATTELIFGDYDVNFDNGEFVDVKKSLNGVMVSSYTDNWSGKVAIGQTKSEPQKYETYGTEERVYKLGKTFILEGSVKVFVNNKEKKENQDYTIDYFEGEITFAEPKTKVDYIKIIYEFTNPIQDFIPSLSRKSFTGAQYQWRPSDIRQKIILDTASASETLWDPANEDSLTYNPKFQLKNTPVILGSETISHNGRRLNHISDYYLKHNSGILILRNIRLRKGDTLTASYQHYVTETVTENITANGTPGPYYLSRNKILYNSVDVYLEGMKAKEIIDYMLDYENGKLYFNYKIPYPYEIIVKHSSIKSSMVTPNIEETPFNIGLTYLEENSKLRDDIIVDKENETPSVSGNVLITNFNPIEESRDITITIDGGKIPTSSYEINYYKGEIEFNDRAQISGIVKITYAYRKSYTTEISFRGISGKSTYTVFDLNPPNLPIKNNGLMRLTLYPNEIELEEGRDFTISYLDKGEDLQLTFLTGYPSFLNALPNENNTIKFQYKYSPDSDADQGKSEQKMLDMIINYKVHENWALQTEYAHSYYNFSKSRQEAEEQIIISADNTNQEYSLNKKPVVDGTEAVYINGISQTRDKDYYINYDKGTIRFLNQSLPTNTQVLIKYEYYKTDLPESKNTSAYKVESKYDFSDNVALTNSLKFLDPNFRSIGGLKEEKGTLALNSGLTWEINASDNVSFDYDKREKLNENYQKLKTEEEFKTNANLMIMDFETAHSLRFKEIEASGNLITSGNLAINDLKATAYDNSIAFGPSFLRSTISGTLSQEQRNQTSTENMSDTLITGYGIATLYEPENPWLVKNLNFTPYYFYNSNKEEKHLKEDDRKKIIESKGIKSNATIIENLVNTGRFEQKDIFYENFSLENPNIQDTYYNYSNLTSYAPFKWFRSSYGLDHNETISPIPGQEDKVEDIETYRVDHLGPYLALKKMGVPNYLYSLFLGSKATALNGNTKDREYNALKKYKQNRQRYTFSNFQPIKGTTLTAFSYETRKSNSDDNRQTSAQIGSESNLNYSKLDGNLQIKPVIDFLKPFSYNWNFAIASSNTFTVIDFTESTKNTTDRSLIEDLQSHKITYNPGNFNLPFFLIANPVAGFEFKRNERIDESITQKLLNNEAREPDGFILDNQIVSANIYTVGFSPWNLFSLDKKITDQKEYYNRNRSVAAQGSLYKKFVDQATNFNMSPFSFLAVSSYYNDNRLHQYTVSTINVSAKDLQISSDKYLNLNEELYGIKNTFTPFTLISLSGAVDTMQANQKLYENNNLKDFDEFRQDKYTAGLTLRPLDGLELSYDYSVKKMEQNSIGYSGNEDKWTIRYKPINYKNFNVNIEISKTKSWGFGFNDIARDNILQSSGEVLDLQVVDRDDAVLLGSLSIQIDIPLDNFRYLERLTITGEGYAKEIEDQKNPDNEFSITGFVIKTSIFL